MTNQKPPKYQSAVACESAFREACGDELIRGKSKGQVVSWVIVVKEDKGHSLSFILAFVLMN